MSQLRLCYVGILHICDFFLSLSVSSHPAGRGRGRTIGWPRFNGPAGHVLHLTPDRDVVVVSTAATAEAARAREACAFWNVLARQMEGGESGGQGGCGGNSGARSSTGATKTKEEEEKTRPKKFRPLKIRTRRPTSATVPATSTTEPTRRNKRSTTTPGTTTTATTTITTTTTATEVERPRYAYVYEHSTGLVIDVARKHTHTLPITSGLTLGLVGILMK